MNLLNLSFIDGEPVITVADRTFTPMELHHFVIEAMCHEERAKNIVARRHILKAYSTEPAVHACLSHLDNLR